MIVSYHRIANHPTCCHLDVFENQVKLAKKIGAILTFDDGLKEHYTVALPILQKYGVTGHFFVITNSDKQVVASHKIWLLLEQSKDLIKHFNIGSEKFLNPVWYQYDDPKIANLKFYLNTHGEELDEIFREKFDEQEQIEKLYMNWDEITMLHAAGMNIGCHTHTHPILSLLSDEEQENEIRISTEIISRRTEKPFAFAYPLNGYNNATLRLLKKYGYWWAMTSEPVDLLRLGRVDTNEFRVQASRRRRL